MANRDHNPLRGLPRVDELLALPTLQQAASSFARARIVEAIRAELNLLREQVWKDGELNGSSEPTALAERVSQRLERESAPRLGSVINATGIVLHTNLGRAPLAEVAANAANEAGRWYLNLEMDLQTGQRSSRQDAIRSWLCQLTGAESATVVNNNAAATIIVLRAICQGKEVIVSRGQLVEIGGSFRIPEIMSVSGAILREVGTTNITRVGDYAKAINPATGGLLRVHASNYRIRGFTQSATLAELVHLAKQHDLPVIDDAGSGALLDFARFGFDGEPVISTSVAEGADLVLFSGDKLLGGPQAGIIVGQRRWIEKIERDPLMRAFRVDKMTLAALETTLRLYLNEAGALQSIPLLRMLNAPITELRQRAEALALRLGSIPGVRAVPREETAFVGGGSLPDQTMPTWVVAINFADRTDNELAQQLRVGKPAVVGRLHGGQLLLDVRTVFAEQQAGLIAAIERAVC